MAYAAQLLVFLATGCATQFEVGNGQELHCSRRHRLMGRIRASQMPMEHASSLRVTLSNDKLYLPFDGEIDPYEKKSAPDSTKGSRR